ncbi:MAG TPA: enoyl-CoA hydratase-related protein [Gemmatimonadota bacterium]|nr:enoyl-CoA hydratase-related protein [Gemmatimonadota bacterium]
MSAPGAGSGAAAPAAPGIRSRLRDGVVRITLDRPPLNVLDAPMLEALTAALDAARRDPDTRVVLLSAAGDAFCAGVDVAAHAPERAPAMIRVFGAAVRGLLTQEAPVVAAVDGAALGGGCELALACDVVLASERSRFGQPEVRVGALPPAAAVLLPRRVGPSAAMDLVLSGRTVGAEEALRIGLVTRLLPAEGFGGEVEAYVAGLASLSRPVLRLARRAVREGASGPLGAALDRADRTYVEDLLGLDDAAEGISAFLEKRPPVWKDA